MKIGKLLILCFIVSIVFFACEEDENQGNILTPRADFSYTPTAPVEGKEIIFSADPEEGSSEISSWSWSFGDEDSTTSAETDPSFIYENPGTYEVTLEVVDVSQNVFRTTKHLTVAKAEFPASIVWEFTNNTTVARLNEGSNAPVIGDDGSIYYVEGNAGAESKVVAVTDQGEDVQLKWAAALGNQISNAPAMGPDGNIYINAWLANGVFKLNAASGEVLWNSPTVAQVSNNTPAIDDQGNIYHGSRSNALAGIFSWSPTGEKRWEIVGVGAFYASPALSKDGNTVYYLNTDNGEIWAVNTVDGTLKWDSPVGTGTGGPGPSVSIDGDGTIYFTTNTHVAAVTDDGASGSLKWSIEVAGAANSGVVIGPEGNLYTGSVNGLLSINPADGAINWTYDAEISESVPAVDVNGNIYVGTADGKLLIVDPEGELLKELELGDNVVNSPTIASDGTVYIEVMDGSVIKLYKIAVAESGPANSPWPMKGQNVKNTGQAI